jgi:16S rRNA (cytosine1402-N4)-methyltransferase
LLDIGISSVQLDDSGRGFTFQKDEPLLMTMESEVIPDVTLAAKDLINTSSEEALADIIYAYGEEKFARKIAKAIVDRRRITPLLTTFELVSVVESAVPSWYKRGKTNPATKTFQALRIAVNDELGALSQGIKESFEILKPGGRLAVISFHSLEDRIVKNMFRDLVKEERGELVSKKPIGPSRKEEISNPRARSAKLRVIQKI